MVCSKNYAWLSIVVSGFFYILTVGIPRHGFASECGPLRFFYHEVTTGSAPPDAPLPLIIAIHGLGDSPERFVRFLDGFSGQARVVLPQGPRVLDRGYGWMPVRVKSGKTALLSASIRDHAADLAAFVDAITLCRATVGKVRVFGFSQGGMLAFALAVHHGSRFELAIPVGGWLPPPLWPTADSVGQHLAGTAPPIWVLHGQADPAVPFGPTQKAVDRLQKVGFHVALFGFANVGHTMTSDMRVLLHRWLRDPVTLGTPP